MVPEDHILDSPLLLRRVTWQLFASWRSNTGDISYFFYNSEDAYDRRDQGVLYHLHRYEVVGRQWTYLHCNVYEPRGRGHMAYVLVPPGRKEEVELLWLWEARHRQRRQV